MIDGKEIFGTVTEKIKPNVNATPEENQEPVELPEIPATENAPAALIGDNPPAENKPTENPQAVQAETTTVENSSPTENKTAAENSQPQPPKIPDKFKEQEKPNDKFIIKISIPAERDFDCLPNTAVVVKIKL